MRHAASILLTTTCLAVFPVTSVQAQPRHTDETQVDVESAGWTLVGDLVLPRAEHVLPAVIMLNQAAGDRTVYRPLADQLAERNIASLRLDLRGHGESTNQGTFVPGETPRSPLIWDSEVDVIAAYEYMMAHPSVDPTRIAIVGASYSGEEMAEAGRVRGYAHAYVALSPGSFGEKSISGVDSSLVDWLFVTAREDPYLREITALLKESSIRAEIWMLPGDRHATDLLDEYDDLSERIAVWLARRLNRGPGARYGHDMTYDSLSEATILFGGFGPNGRSMADTWALDDSGWQLVAVDGPTPRRWPAMAYDARRNQVVLFGGRKGMGREGESLSDTWLWKAGTWVSSDSRGPDGRDHHRMVYDSNRERIVMFGGWDGQRVLGDTWEWDGSDWTKVSETGPGPRAAFGLAYHEGSRLVVLMGGQDEAGPMGDTWIWDGTDWHELEMDGPASRSFHTMSYDPMNQRVLLYGGRDRDALYTDLWAWDDGVWAEIGSDGPRRRGVFASTVDARLGGLIFHGGGDLVDEEWHLESATWSWSDSLGWKVTRKP